jgi:MFS superfamily sulfate permease-like transporter
VIFLKGQTREMLNLLTLIVGISIAIVLSYFLFFSKIPQTKSLAIEYNQYYRTLEFSRNIFYIRIPGIDKVLAQLIGDMIVNKNEIVDYGNEYGKINVTKIIYDIFDFYFDKNWNFKVSYEEKDFAFGYRVPNEKRVRSYPIKLPLPSFEGEIINVEFRQW